MTLLKNAKIGGFGKKIKEGGTGVDHIEGLSKYLWTFCFTMMAGMSTNIMLGTGEINVV